MGDQGQLKNVVNSLNRVFHIFKLPMRSAGDIPSLKEYK
jgi:hypothetical protein